MVDFFLRKDALAYVCRVNYDPYRTAKIGLILYENGMFAAILLADNVDVGLKVFSAANNSQKIAHTKGSSLLFRDIGLFSIISNFETRPFFGTTVARSAGTGAILVSKSPTHAILKLRSG